MKTETIAIHAGYEDDPATHSVALPIYQTAAYSFDSADHAAALFNLESQGFRYTRISSPTVAPVNSATPLFSFTQFRDALSSIDV